MNKSCASNFYIAIMAVKDIHNFWCGVGEGYKNTVSETPRQGWNCKRET
jgi:hypothetical protein